MNLLLRKITLITFFAANTFPNVSIAQTAELTDNLDSQKEACSKDPNKTWSEQKQRCEGTQDSYELRAEYQKCEAIEDATERNNCIKSLADAETSDIDFQKAEKGETGKALIHAAYGGLAAINIFGKSGTSSSCMSAQILGVTALAGIASEFYLKKYTKDQLKDLEKGFKADSETDPYSTQIQSFQYLKQEQETVAKVAGMRKKIYYVLTAGYGAATAMVVYDSTFGSKSCSSKEQQMSPEEKKLTMDEQKLHGSTTTDPSIKESLTAGFDKFTGFMKTPWGVGILGATATTYSYFLAKKAGDQQKEAKANSAKVSEIIVKLQTGLAGFCPQGHDDINNTRCYCYNVDNSKNEDHSKSETCQMLWAQDDSLFKKTNDKYATDSKPTGCVTLEGKFDAGCTCRKYKNAKGNNACMKSTLSKASTKFQIPGLNANAFDEQATAILGGNTQGATLSNVDTLSKNAAIGNKAKEVALKKINETLKKQGNSPLVLNEEGMKKMSSNLMNAAEIKSSNMAPMIATSAPKDPAVSKAIEQAKEKANITASYSKPKDIKKSNKKSSGFSFDMGGGSRNSGNKVETFAEKKYDYKNNDIHTRKDIPIWKVISNRYMQTGLKRLFPDEDL